MKRQVVGAGKASVAVGAAEGFDARVLAIVPRQLIRTGEAPCATFPSALVWLFTCVYPPVGFQMRALGVNFVATIVIAHVHAPSFHVWRVGVDVDVHICIYTGFHPLHAKRGRYRLCAALCITVSLILDWRG